MIEQRSLGRLTLEKELDNDFLQVRCNCGYPLIVSSEMWEAGEVLGCAVCDPLERAERKAEQEAEAQARANEIAAKEDEATRFAKFVDPHMEDLSPDALKLLRLMGERPIDVEGIMKRLDENKTDYQPPTTKKEAWNLLTSLIACNVVLEYRGATKDVRPYSEWEYYSAQCLPGSSYGYRRGTRRLLEELDQAAEKEQANKVEAVKADQVADHLRAWITARCVVASKASASIAILRDDYVKWATEDGKKELDLEDWNEQMIKAGFKLAKTRLQGIRPKTAQELAEFQQVADLPLAVDLTAVKPIIIESELQYHN